MSVENSTVQISQFPIQSHADNLSLHSPELALEQVTEPVYTSDQLKEYHEVLLSFHPYPEDSAPVEREIASLQLPSQYQSDARSSRGVIVGIEPSDTLHDLAVVSTILAAAPYQCIRYKKLKQKQQQLLDQLKQMELDQGMPHYLSRRQQLLEQLTLDPHHRPFLLSRSDLRRYRRAPSADLMLLILLDYTCLRDCNWRDVLLPYLVTAYTERASIYIVQVGMKNAVHELRAEVVKGRNILTPVIDDALIDAPGRATPLAHGFDLTLQTLRHALQHGRSTVRRVLLLVISDGRGNVSLENSREGYVSEPVYHKGIEDAFQLAEQLRDFKNVKKVLLNPQPEQYSDLPLLLAEAMGAEIEDIPGVDRGEVKV